MEKPDKENLPAQPGIIFMGTPDFAVPSLKTLIEYGHNILAVVTQPDKPKGRGRKVTSTPVKQLALDYGLDVLQPQRASEKEFCETIRKKSPDVLIVVAFGQILKNELLEIPKFGAINIHASLLPKYRGAAPVHWAVMNDEHITGLTSMKINEALDAGPILLQEEVAVFPGESAGSLYNRLAVLSGGFLIKTLVAMSENKIRERLQDHTAATYASKIDRSMALIRWDQPAHKIAALIRALDPWPGAFTAFRGKEIKFFSPVISGKDQADLQPGRVCAIRNEGIEIETGEGALLVKELQLSGKKRLPAKDLLLGFALHEGDVFGI